MPLHGSSTAPALLVFCCSLLFIAFATAAAANNNEEKSSNVALHKALMVNDTKLVIAQIREGADPNAEYGGVTPIRRAYASLTEEADLYRVAKELQLAGATLKNAPDCFWDNPRNGWWQFCQDYDTYSMGFIEPNMWFHYGVKNWEADYKALEYDPSRRQPPIIYLGGHYHTSEKKRQSEEEENNDG